MPSTILLLVSAVVALPLESASSLSSAPPNLCARNATLGDVVLTSLNLTYPGLEAVARAYGQGDYGTACDALVRAWGCVVSLLASPVAC
jgi:hypothetical protein